MKEKEIELSVYLVRDRRRTVKYLVVDNILDDELQDEKV
jgi:hypothetical protein